MATLDCHLVCKMGTIVASSHGYDNTVRYAKCLTPAWPTVGPQQMPGHWKDSQGSPMAMERCAGMPCSVALALELLCRVPILGKSLNFFVSLDLSVKWEYK